MYKVGGVRIVTELDFTRLDNEPRFRFQRDPEGRQEAPPYAKRGAAHTTNTAPAKAQGEASSLNPNSCIAGLAREGSPRRIARAKCITSV